MALFEDAPRISPMLWFDSEAEQAVSFYLGVFKNSKRIGEFRSKTDSPPLTITFELEGQRFTALNGGPLFKFNEAISFIVRCDSQQEVDEYWAKLSDEGSEGQCGWLKDKFGVSWQIVPVVLPELIKHPKAMEAMLKMKKVDIAELRRAASS